MAIKTDLELNNIFKRFIEELDSNNVDYYGIYLFGSYISGNPDEWSDIDIAVLTNDNSLDKFDFQLKLMKISRDVDINIEPHVFFKDEFNENNPFANLIINNGRKIA